ncbi:MAG: SPFH domain-containing protein [Eubacteriales bacterium]|nr:SPFH domain-containing protein [Eubacteriales bacterium]
MSKAGVVIGIVGAAALAGGIYTIASIETIPTGKVGVQYSTGGVKNEVLDEGWHFINPLLKVKEFTVGNEQLILSKDKREGSKGNEAFNVATSDDASIAVSFQMSYRYIPDKVVDTYRKFKGMDGEDIVERRVKSVLKSKISEITTDYSMMDIYSGNRSELNTEITKHLNAEFNSDYGIEVLDASIIDVHPDKKLKSSIDARVKALQEKQQAKAEQEKLKVQKETEKIQAQADAEIERINAQTKADKLKIQAEAEAEANKVVSSSITEELIRMKEAEARLKHGWITVQGADAVVTAKK